ncbi:MAG: alanine--tRNA ligase [Candidatus Marinimicrobia bacterium]|nr:alanine--tRNA ligase [Candidatus Neomarinimicrobiota bacterium]
MDSSTIRKQFIEYFEKTLGHTVVPSASVIPLNDPTLLFTNAGMNPFKPYFLGELEPPFRRVVNSQKCIRVSGKHNDLEAVGRDHYHHTFFEMLGSWSFGDYYKKEAILWAWKLFTEVWKIDPRRLYATVYTDDSEALKIWKSIPDIEPEQILIFGEKDNFWSMGDIGPCGPCSEIHYYRGDKLEDRDAAKVNADDPDYQELWNLVFIQYNRDEKGELHPLKNKHIDTGAGFERIVAALNGMDSNYDTDLFRPLIDQIEALSDIAYDKGEEGMAHRVIADHIRMLTIAISDGAIPGNEGRSYVLRRILRRAARFGRKLNLKEPFLYRLVPTVAHILGDVYPEIVVQREHVQRILRAEEESFGNTLDKGLELFEQLAKKAKKTGESVLNSEDVFRLYDTFGFPVDLTRLLAEEKGLAIREKEIDDLMEQQRQRARAAGKFKMRSAEELQWIILRPGVPSVFAGYDTYSISAQPVKYAADENYTYLVVDKTPFYAESGGQTGDKGHIVFTDPGTGKMDYGRVLDAQKIGNDIVHIIEGRIFDTHPADSGPLILEVNESTRRDTARNHSATHLLHAALRKMLGDHVHQSGSYVGPDRLRFDFTHYEKVSPQQQREIQQLVNLEILKNLPVETEEKHYIEAVSGGAQALFGEKYGDIVRVVKMGDVSMELCGGTHVGRTGDIGPFFIVGESSVASGIRRIEAVTGTAGLDMMQAQQTLLADIRDMLRTPEARLKERVSALGADMKVLEKENAELKAKLLSSDISGFFEGSGSYRNAPLYVNRVEVENIDQLKNLGDRVREKMKTGVAIFGSVIGGMPQVLCVVSDDLVKEGVKAGNIVKSLGKAIGGGGGGKPHMATAGGKDPVLLEDVLNHIETYLP